ncbi:MAG: hypothetical protein AB7H90_20105 [Alphaproteobacteria bacterium]
MPVLDRVEHDLRPCGRRERIVDYVWDFAVLPAIPGALDGYAKRLRTAGVIEQYRVLGNYVSHPVEIPGPAEDDAPLEHCNVINIRILHRDQATTAVLYPARPNIGSSQETFVTTAGHGASSSACVIRVLARGV